MLAEGSKVWEGLVQAQKQSLCLSLQALCTTGQCGYLEAPW